MNMITVTAKTLDEAITKALIELGTTSDNLEYTVIEKGSSGFLGLFGKNVVIRANKKKEDDDLEAFLATGRIDSSSLGKSVKEEKKEKSAECDPMVVPVVGAQEIFLLCGDRRRSLMQLSCHRLTPPIID